MAAMARAKAWLFDIFAHNHAEQLRIQRAAQRQHMHVDQQDLPYPGAVQQSGNPVTVLHTGGGWLKGALLGAALLAGGGGGALGLMTLLKPTASFSAVPVPVTAPKPVEWDIELRMNPDGTWNRTVKPVPPAP